MDIFSFTTIILMLFIIIGAYLIFTNQTDGRPKIILTVAVLICFLYVLLNLGIFKSYTESKSSPMDALTVQTVSAVDTTASSFSLSTWIYITELNSASTKTIFSLTNPDVGSTVASSLGPKIVLGPYNNELIITYNTNPSASQRDDWEATGRLGGLFTAYNTAKTNWISASNNERNDKGYYKSAAPSTTEAADKIANLSAPFSSYSTATETARVALVNARKAYDGGTVGIGPSFNTILTPSTKRVNTPGVAGVTASAAGVTPVVEAVTAVAEVSERIAASISESPNIINNDMYGGLTGSGLSGQPLRDYQASGLYKYTSTPENLQGSWNATTSTATSSLETIKIKEISIQKWVNVVVTFGDNTVDTYINGKLVDSHVSTGTGQTVSSVAKDTTLNWGGFTGYISSSRYYPRFLTPQEAWDIYKAGFSDNMFGNFLNQYNAKFTFTQNQVEKASFNIF